jgi:hypothetical protein
MALKVLPNGIGAQTGPVMVREEPAAITGTIYFVGPTGNDTTHNGKRRDDPFLTTSKATSLAVAGDTVVYLPDHIETFAALVTVAVNYLTFISEGLGSHRAQLICGNAAGLFRATGVGTRFMNLTFPASTTAPTRRVWLNGDRNLIEDCDFTCGALDATATVEFQGGSLSTVRLTRFVATAAQAKRPVYVSASAEGLFFDTTTFDGGGFGWNDALGTAISPDPGVLLVGFAARSMRLLNGSSVSIGNGGSTTAFISMASDSGEPLIYST